MDDTRLRKIENDLAVAFERINHATSSRGQIHEDMEGHGDRIKQLETNSWRQAGALVIIGLIVSIILAPLIGLKIKEHFELQKEVQDCRSKATAWGVARQTRSFKGGKE